MPGLVTSYEQGAAWKKSPVGQKLTQLLADKGIVIVTWIWQAGGVAIARQADVAPEDAKGMKVRGGSREMDMMLKAAGAADPVRCRRTNPTRPCRPAPATRS